jgi:hypothetical protein
MSFEQLEPEKKLDPVVVKEYRDTPTKYFKNEGEVQHYIIKNYWFFSPRPEREGRLVIEEGTNINQLQKEVVKAFNQGQSDGAEFMKEHFDEICQEYKIHIQPNREEYHPEQKDWRPFFVDKLIQALAGDKELQESIDRFKASWHREIIKGNSGEVMPDIVIYPRTGKENFAKALVGVYQLFENEIKKIKNENKDEKCGSDEIPRYNFKFGNSLINDSIFVAQSGGDFKDALKKLGVLDKYFDETNNYAFSKGEKPPFTIDKSKNFTELFLAIELAFPKGLQGTRKLYEVSELIDLINKVRDGKEDSSAITRTEGLRKKVEELLESEKIRK